MKYWIIIENRQHGPLTSEEIAASGWLRRDTPVWHEGLAGWVTADEVDELAALLRPPSGRPAAPAPVCPGASAYGNGHRWVQAPVVNVEPEPESFLLWSILTTILCCIPTGIIAIIMSTRVSGRYACGDYEGARRASRAAELWVVVTITVGLVAAPFVTLLGMV